MKFIVGPPNRWNRFTQKEKLGALVLIVIGLVICAIGLVVYMNEPAAPVKAPSPVLDGWGLSDWLTKVLVPILIIGGVLLLIIKKDASLLKFAAIFIVILIGLAGIGKGIGSAWDWISKPSTGSSNTGTGFVTYDGHQKGTSQPDPVTKAPSTVTPTPAPTTAPAKPADPISLTIKYGSYISATGWDKVGTGTHGGINNFWAEGSGTLVYKFNAPRGGRGTIAVAASSYDESNTSQVTLIVNGVAKETRTFGPFEDGGEHYIWEIPIQLGVNQIAFQVTGGNYGLAFFGPIAAMVE